MTRQVGIQVLINPLSCASCCARRCSDPYVCQLVEITPPTSAVTLRDNPSWRKISALMTINLKLSYVPRSPSWIELYLPDLFHISVYVSSTRHRTHSLKFLKESYSDWFSASPQQDMPRHFRGSGTFAGREPHPQHRPILGQSCRHRNRQAGECTASSTCHATLFSTGRTIVC